MLRYILTNNVNTTLKDWTKTRITANGLSSSKPILVNGRYDGERSRRVEFRVRLDATIILNDALQQNLK